MGLKIVVADDHQIIREGICNMLASMTDMEVVGEASNGRTAFRLARKFQPDIIIMDISMPELNGIEATRQIKAEFPDIKIIALSMYADKRFVLGMLKAGVSGYLLKDCAFSELTGAITVVRKGETYLSSRIADTVRKTLIDKLEEGSQNLSDELTDRERQVLQLIAEGVKTKEIADQLHISVKTVETYRRHIMEKLNLHSVAELTKFAVREGLTEL
ncbi:MAG: response regulator transcription factor [Thermodesulfobacteriota bacterium]|nr:response regulator transcription factor [Thermodesulfobacteriota bacterium]